MYEIAICDACTASRRSLEGRVRKLGADREDTRVHMYRTGVSLLEAMRFIRFSLILLNARSRGIGGTNAGEQVRSLDPDVVLAFHGGYAKPSLKSFKAQPYRYITDGMDSDGIDQYIKDCLDRMAVDAWRSKIGARSLGREMQLWPDDIVYVEKYRKGARAYVSERSMLRHGFKACGPRVYIAQRLWDLYDRLKLIGFGRPHDSYLINFRYLKSCAEQTLELEGFPGQPFKIARSKCEEFFFLRDLFADKADKKD